MPLDGLLKKISRRVKQSEKTLKPSFDSQIQEDLLREFITFTHSVALCNLTLRFRARREADKPRNAPSNLQKWYTAIYHLDSRCGNPNCHQTLPNPRDIYYKNRLLQCE